ncbi:MAG TPA: NUDIX hydrolase [Rhodopila sp.]|nr:NUDIX hydrolase [Rhodopila sp.]
MRKLPIKSGRGRQYAALPFIEENGETKVLLVTSRETRRWVFPKGWAEKGLSGPELARKECFEEAGVRGEVAPKKVGTYTYMKRMADGREVDCKVDVFPMHVTQVLDAWPERGQRERRWFTLSQAAFEVEEGELVTLLLRLAAPDPARSGPDAA